MRSIGLINPVVRATVVIGAVAALVTGVTFAALQSQATLADSTISSANANLLLWDGDTFESQAPGFTVTGLIPGEGSGKQFFYFQNAGDTALNLSVHVPAAPAEPGDGYGFSGWENLKVTFTNEATDQTVDTDMAALMAGNVTLPGNPLPFGAQGNNQAGQENTPGNFSAEFDIDPSAVTGDHAGVGAFDMTFTGTATATPAP